MVILLFHRIRATQLTLLLAVSWLYVCSTALFADFLMGTLEQDFRPQGHVGDGRGGCDRGARRRHPRRYAYGVPLPDLNQQADRLVYAAALYKAGKAPVIVLSGGQPRGMRARKRS